MESILNLILQLQNLTSDEVKNHKIYEVLNKFGFNYYYEDSDYFIDVANKNIGAAIEIIFEEEDDGEFKIMEITFKYE